MDDQQQFDAEFADDIEQLEHKPVFLKKKSIPEAILLTRPPSPKLLVDGIFPLE